MLKCESGRWALGRGRARRHGRGRAEGSAVLPPLPGGFGHRPEGAPGFGGHCGDWHGSVRKHKAKVNQGFALRFEFGGKIRS